MHRWAFIACVAFAIALEACGRSKDVPITSESASPTDVVAPRRPAPECEQGPLRYSAASDEERARVIAKFREQNAVVAGDTLLDPLGRTVTMSGTIQTSNGDRPDATDAELEANARAFLQRIADFFAIDPSEVEALAAQKPRWMGARFMVQLGSRKPIPGYELFGLERTLRFTVSLTRAGDVAHVSNGSDELPRFSLCTTPLLHADDPAVKKQVIGRSTSFSDAHGRQRTVGPLTQNDLGQPALRVYVGREGTKGERLTIALAYAMDFFGGGFTAFVDANTGEFLGIQQNFLT